MWAHGFVFTRNFRFDDDMFLIPYADFFNHGNKFYFYFKIKEQISISF
jgi:hypothetical protein